MEVMTSAEIEGTLEALGVVVSPPGARTYTQFLQSEVELWTKAIRTAGIEPE